MKRIPLAFYLRGNTLDISQELLGKILMTCVDGVYTGGMIIETEAYMGPEDKASHAYGGRRTKRNKVMYQQGGLAYVYRIYGIHYMLNIVTNQAEIPHAILIRGIKPIIGIEEMLKRRMKKEEELALLAKGPGTLTQALGINMTHNGLSLIDSTIWLEDHGIEVDPKAILKCPRVGIDYAEEFVHLPWRFIYQT